MHVELAGLLQLEYACCGELFSDGTDGMHRGRCVGQLPLAITQPITRIDDGFAILKHEQAPAESGSNARLHERVDARYQWIGGGGGRGRFR